MADIVVGNDWLAARYPHVQCVYVGGQVDDRSFDEFLLYFAADIDARSSARKIGVFYYSPDAAMDSSRRRRLAKILNDRKEKLARTTAAYALATDSPFVRGVLTTLFWMAPPGYPYKMVASPEQGLAFIAEHRLGVDPQAIARSFLEILETREQRAS